MLLPERSLSGCQPPLADRQGAENLAPQMIVGTRAAGLGGPGPFDEQASQRALAVADRPFAAIEGDRNHEPGAELVAALPFDLSLDAAISGDFQGDAAAALEPRLAGGAEA